MKQEFNHHQINELVVLVLVSLVVTMTSVKEYDTDPCVQAQNLDPNFEYEDGTW
jgi:hypothetical protein